MPGGLDPDPYRQCFTSGLSRRDRLLETTNTWLREVEKHWWPYHLATMIRDQSQRRSLTDIHSDRQAPARIQTTGQLHILLLGHTTDEPHPYLPNDDDRSSRTVRTYRVLEQVSEPEGVRHTGAEREWRNGRRAGLRIQWLRTCGFKSRLAHPFATVSPCG